MRKNATGVWVAMCMVVCVASTLTGCTLDVLPEMPNENDNGNDGDNGGMGVPSRVVEVRLRNLTTDIAVDVELHISSDPLANLPGDLFAEENFFGIGIGLGGNGRIGPGEEEIFDIDCDEGMGIGTLGGSFLNAETGELVGTGNQKWLQEGAQFNCGAVILFEYRGEVDDFSTLLSLLGG